MPPRQRSFLGTFSPVSATTNDKSAILERFLSRKISNPNRQSSIAVGSRNICNPQSPIRDL